MFLESFKIEFRQKKTMIFFILASLLFVIGSFAQFKKSVKSTNNDFRVYYKTAVRLENKDWKEIYTRNDGAFPYRYVPYTLPVVTWMDYFPEQVSRKIWVVVQSLAFLIGFIYLYKSLVLTKSSTPLLAISLTILLTFRQFMDSLYSGQVAGFIFMSFSLGLYFYIKQKFVKDGIANSIATSLKIMPGYILIHGLIKAPGFKLKMQFLLSGILLFIGLNAALFVWLKLHASEMHFLDLWKNWLEIVLADGEYFDGSTPKSQSLRAFILRTFGKSHSSEMIYKVMFLLGTIGLILHWIKGKTLSVFQMAYSYCLGILAFIIFMPESLPYQLMNIAIPFAVFLADPKIKASKFNKFVFVAFILSISFASTDFIGRHASDWMQDQSFAFMAMCLLTIVVVKGSLNSNHVVKT